MSDQKNTKIGWDLPGCDPSGEGHHQHPHNPPSAPEMVPNLPRIPNQTGIADTCTSDSKFTYGCCLPTSPEVPLQDHLLGRPINAFLSPSNKNRAQLEKHEFWVKGSQGSIPAGAIEGGQEADGQPLYVVRAELEGSLTPGKLSSHGCHISWGSAEHQVHDYEVLCGLNGTWVRADRDKLPEKALKAGYSESGEILFVGRVKHQGNLTPGKVQPSHNVCYVPFGGKEVSYHAYEVFVVDQ